MGPILFLPVFLPSTASRTPGSRPVDTHRPGSSIDPGRGTTAATGLLQLSDPRILLALARFIAGNPSRLTLGLLEARHLRLKLPPPPGNARLDAVAPSHPRSFLRPAAPANLRRKSGSPRRLSTSGSFAALSESQPAPSGSPSPSAARRTAPCPEGTVASQVTSPLAFTRKLQATPRARTHRPTASPSSAGHGRRLGGRRAREARRHLSESAGGLLVCRGASNGLAFSRAACASHTWPCRAPSFS